MNQKTRCPKCGFDSPQPITKSEDKLYCPKCKHAWEKGKEEESLKTEGSLDFEGVDQAKQIIKMFLKNADISPELKTALASQLTSAFFEQWFEGFKTGLLADIVHKREFTNGNGKNGTKPGKSDRQHRDGVGSPDVKADENSIRRKEGAGTRKAFERVKERVAGVNFLRPRHLAPTERQYQQAAVLVDRLRGTGPLLEEIYFDGTHYHLKYKS